MTTLLDKLRPVHEKVDGWLFGPVPSHALLICRVGLGSILFLAYLFRWPLVEVLYGPTGYAGYAYSQRFPESSDLSWALVHRLDVLQHISTSGPIWSLYLILLISSLFFAMGIRPKISGTIALVLHVLFVARNPGATWGWATMIQPFMVYTIFAATREHWSVTSGWLAFRGNPRGPTQWTCPAWPQRLLQIHLTCVFLVLWTRFDEQSWLTGQTLAFALTNRDWSRFDIDLYPYFQWLEFASVSALVLECGAPIALWIKPIGKFWALGLIGMFVMLTVTTSVGWWDLMMICVLVVFLPAPWLERLMRPLVGSAAPTPQASSTAGSNSS